MKKVILSSLVTASLMAPTITLPFVTTSCSETTIDINTNEKNKIVKDRDFSIDFVLSNLSLHDVKVALVGETTGALSIVNETIDIFLDSGTINLHINESIHYSKEFFFSIQFTVQRGTKVETILVDGFKIYYNPSHEQLVDLIKIDEKLVEKSDSWIFEYKFQFSNMPLSNVVPALINEKTKLISIIDESVVVEKVDSTYICTVRIQLSYSVYKSRVIPFNLLLSFTNSYGLEQHEVINSMALSFVGYKTSEIPVELLNITHEQDAQGNEKNVLRGFVPTVLPQTVLPYSTLTIPEDVDEIEKDAFADQDFCQGIQKIIFKGMTQNVGEHAFYGCVGLKEFDISLFMFGTSIIPPDWINPRIEQGHPTLFNTNNMTHIHSILWIDSSWERGSVPSKIKPLCDKLGFPQVSADVSGAYPVAGFWAFPDEFYNVVEIDGEKVLKNVNRKILDDYGNLLTVIRLPKGINRIAPNALSPLAGCPTQYNEPRILILNEELTTIEGENAFSYLGLDGPIIMPSGIKTIPNRTFEHASEFVTGIDLGNNMVIDFNCCNELESIGDYAFANNKNLVEVCGLPRSLGDDGATFGQKVFDQCKKLELLDFSKINVPYVGAGWNDDPFGENIGDPLKSDKICYVPAQYSNLWGEYLVSKGIDKWVFSPR